MRLVLVFVVLLAAVGLAGCSGDGGDQDGDGLSDGMERRGWDIYVDLLGQRVIMHVTSDPLVYDTDNDGLSDFDEWAHPAPQGNTKPGLNPRSVDTDGDGLTDCQETLHTRIADCENADFSGPYDGGYGTLPGDADSDPGFGRYWGTAGRPFSDPYKSMNVPRNYGDGISDGVEIMGHNITINNRIVRVTTNPLDTDTDGDGLYDGEEALLYKSNPMVPDTDGDGCVDGRDPIPDREEMYVVGLDRIKLLRDKDPTGGANLVVTVVISDRVFQLPSSGSRPLQTNQAVSIDDLDPGAQKPNCGAGSYPPNPNQPWLYIGILARDDDGASGSENIDFSSATQAGHEATPGEVYWNVRTGQFSWQIDGSAPFNGPLQFRGVDAELNFSPHLL